MAPGGHCLLASEAEVTAALPASSGPDPLPLIAVPVRIEGQIEAARIERETAPTFHPPPRRLEHPPLRI
jgi:hypothetical protein